MTAEQLLTVPEAPEDGDVKLKDAGVVHANPVDPERDITSLPVAKMLIVGVNTTVRLTCDAATATLLNDMAG